MVYLGRDRRTKKSKLFGPSHMSLLIFSNQSLINMGLQLCDNPKRDQKIYILISLHIAMLRITIITLPQRRKSTI